jgi:hypothetical protein
MAVCARCAVTMDLETVTTPLSPLVITACSNRKRLTSEKKGLARHLKRGSVDQVAKAWATNLKTIKTRVPAEDVYCGRGFIEAQETRDRVNGRLVILSAGLGLVRAETDIPGYSMTVTRGSEDNVLEKLDDLFVSSPEWLAGMRGVLPKGFGLSLSKIARDAPIILCALPNSYMEMISAELCALQEKTQKKFRFFGLGTDASLPSDLQHLWMPYDDRLDGRFSKVRGTRGDFAQRAMRHFAEEIYARAKNRTPEKHAEMVREHLKGWHRAPTFNRQKQTDPQIIRLIKQHWKAVDGRSGAMLRLFRDELEIACEQGRFKLLFKQVAEAKGQ